MKTKNVFRIQHGKIRLRILSLIFILPILLSITACGRENIAINNNLQVQAEMGYNKTVSIWGGNPVKFTVTNAGQDFKGEVRIIMPINYEHQALMVIPVDIPANSQKTIEKYIPINYIKKEFEYEIVSGDYVIKKDKVKVNKFLDPEIVKIGIISDKEDNYKFLDSTPLFKNYDYNRHTKEASAAQVEVEAQGESYTTENFSVNFEDLEKFNDRDAARFFDYIVIGDVSNLKLNDEVKENLLAWVDSGGILIIEAGENFEKVNAILKDELKLVEYEKLKNATIEKKDGSKVSIKLAEGKKLKSEVKEINLFDETLGYYEEIGRGGIINVNTLIDNNSYLLENIVLNSTLTSSVENMDDYGYYRYSLDRIPSKADLPYDLIGFILFAYVIVASPILYLILVKIKKQNLMWVIAPSMAIIVILIISQIGNFVWGNKPIINEASIISYTPSSQSLNVSTNMALFNNKKSDMKIAWDKKDNLDLSRYDYYDYYEEEEFDNRKNAYAYYLQNEPLFYSYDTSLWDYVEGKAKKTIKVEDKGTETTIKNEGDDVILTFKNGLPLDFKQCILYKNSKYYELGAVNSGEEVSINLSTANSFIDLYQIAMPEEEGNDVYESQDMIDTITRQDKGFNKIYIFGYNYEPIGYKIKINDEEPRSFARNLVSIKSDLKMANGTKIEIGESELNGNFYSTYVDKENEIKKDDFNRFTIEFNNYYGDRPTSDIDSEFNKVNAIISEFTIPESVDVSSVTIDFNMSTESSVGSNNLNANQLKDEYYIYNFKEDKFDKVEFEENSHYLTPKEKVIDLEKYMSQDGLIKTLTIKDDAFMKMWYEVKMQGVKVKGVYND